MNDATNMRGAASSVQLVCVDRWMVGCLPSQVAGLAKRGESVVLRPLVYPPGERRMVEGEAGNLV